MVIQFAEATVDNPIFVEEALAFYDDTFPLEVREPHEIFWESLRYAKNNSANNFHFLIGLEGEQIVSFATGHYIKEVNSGFIVYIAATPTKRSKGLGTKTLYKMEELLTEDAKSAGFPSIQSIVLETEKQEVVQTPEEKQDCIKRSRFFERNRYRKYEEIDYYQPPLHDGGERVPLNFYIKNYENQHLSKKEVSAIIRAIYKEKYYSVNGIDQRILMDCISQMGV
ncbi:GNAT family N-acetyltransferase [Brevibacillus sp. SYSU BS000544]|uniref:GNAT family N-acetyltransferase n=1 Tax=Brevibacillus sp. SYSU BS000544 TaxID=3416443 RepID=UPI003CE4A36B